MSTNIELSKTRDLGEIISDTFLFIRENFVPLIKCFFIFCGFFLIATAVISCLQQTKTFGMINNLDTNSYEPGRNPMSAFSHFFGVEYFLLFVFLFLELTAITTTVLSYMAAYKAKGNMPATPEEVWGYVKYYFFRTFAVIFLLTILEGIATMCCLIPGIWLYPILSLIFPIMIFENTTFGYAFGQAFRLIKDNWWATFGVLFVMGIVMYVLILVIAMPVALFTVGSLFVFPTKGIHLSETAIIATTIVSAISHIFYMLPLIALGLCYFNLTELKDSTGLMDRINQLGNNDPGNDLPAEQY